MRSINVAFCILSGCIWGSVCVSGNLQRYRHDDNIGNADLRVARC
jgi:hypothetical protein